MTDPLKPHQISPAKDAANKFEAALITLQLTHLQRATLQASSTTTLRITELNISSNWHYEIGLTPDDEVYISHTF